MKTKISSLIILSAFICLSVGSGQAALRRDPISKKKMGKYEIFLTYGKIENRSDFEVKVGKERGKKVNKNVFVRTNKVKIKIGTGLGLRLYLDCPDPKFSITFVLRHRHPPVINKKSGKIFKVNIRKVTLYAKRSYVYCTFFVEGWEYEPGDHIIEIFKERGKETFAKKNRMFKIEFEAYK